MKGVELKTELNYKTFCILRRSVGWDLRPEVQGRAALAATARAVTAWKEGRPVGMARLIGDGMYWLLVDVVVCPEFQGRGIGRAMVTALLCWARDQLVAGGQVTVHLVSARGKESFYSRLGFTPIPDAGCGAGMRCTLRAQT